MPPRPHAAIESEGSVRGMAPGVVPVGGLRHASPHPCADPPDSLGSERLTSSPCQNGSGRVGVPSASPSRRMVGGLLSARSSSLHNSFAGGCLSSHAAFVRFPHGFIDCCSSASSLRTV
eukprot:CAMPEP_0181182548 /NCGR_PEP_ID=MMETSP1096-20121128/7949_1 /TAXON_ID=156174 ORGANISM="Chrysochromulina ericina, Strain CCMP281" /NCGR_SAMPLE_ID=MMETSP1096 /ASSEMBLY_ACC=CAM_ASM_000453 /LENGTH=118 /DNA_ID=CAMNT_0023271165 /DNA_START=188 /DNA_END=544 /DNA_ORIENTATION=+